MTLSDSAISKSEKIAEINQIRTTSLFWSRYDRILTMNGKNINELSKEDAGLARLYAEEEKTGEHSAIPHFAVFLNDAGVVAVQMRTPEELAELLLNRPFKIE